MCPRTRRQRGQRQLPRAPPSSDSVATARAAPSPARKCPELHRKEVRPHERPSISDEHPHSTEPVLRRRAHRPQRWLAVKGHLEERRDAILPKLTAHTPSTALDGTHRLGVLRQRETTPLHATSVAVLLARTERIMRAHGADMRPGFGHDHRDVAALTMARCERRRLSLTRPLSPLYVVQDVDSVPDPHQPIRHAYAGTGSCTESRGSSREELVSAHGTRCLRLWPRAAARASSRTPSRSCALPSLLHRRRCTQDS